MREVGKIVPVILSGGAGNGLWPSSCEATPKQLLPLVTEKTMIQETALRFNSDMYHPPVFICSDAHEPLIRAQMEEIGVEIGAFLIEPVARNTAGPSVVAALHAQGLEEDALILVAPADHHIERLGAFRRVVAASAPVAAHGHLMTFGVAPEYAATGFGYIRKGEALSPGAFVVENFVEKPSEEKAEVFVASGEYFWNTGIFLFHAQTLLEEMETYSPSIYGSARSAYEHASVFGDMWYLEEDAFTACESAPVDKALMEHTKKAGLVPCSLGWHDVGSFKVLHELKAGDKGMSISGNVRHARTRNCLVDTDGPLVELVGVDNLVVIVKDESILIVDLDESRNAKDVASQLHSQGGDVPR